MFSHDDGYATPKIDVRGAVFQEDRVLLVQEREDGGWTLPGDWADVGRARPNPWCAKSVKNPDTRHVR